MGNETLGPSNRDIGPDVFDDNIPRCRIVAMGPGLLHTSGRPVVTSVGRYTFFGTETTQYHYSFAASIISTAPLVFAYLFSQKFLVAGLAAGTEKG